MNNLDTVKDILSKYKKGGIYIKPENRGKFTEYCGGKVTQECISKGKASTDPKIRKRATFAANARKWKHKEGGSIDFLLPSIKKFKDGGKSMSPDVCDLMLKFLWVRDQAHIFHWQTKSNSQHVALGDFYEDYLEELDELTESLFGARGMTFEIKESNNSIMLKNYSEENLSKYLVDLTDLFTKEIPKYIPNTTENVGLYHTIGDIIELINKLKYLLTQD